MLNALLAAMSIDPATLIKVDDTRDMLRTDDGPMLRDEVEQLFYYLDDAADKQVVVYKTRVTSLREHLQDHELTDEQFAALGGAEKVVPWIDNADELDMFVVPNEDGDSTLYRTRINA